MIVETKNASLDTMAVTIQALHVSGKQMTLAVFRQLPTAAAYNDDGTLVDLEHWGIVRYYIKDEGGIWLVASKDGRLFRCSPYPLRIEGGYEPKFTKTSDASSLLNKAKFECGLYCAWENWNKQRQALALSAPKDRAGWMLNSWIKEQLPSEPQYPPHAEKKEGRRGYYENEVKAYERILDTSKRAEASLSQLLALPQLFIAV